MTWTDLRLRIRALLFHRRAERELAEELNSHLEMEIERGLRRGLSPDEARRSALAAFGGAAQIAEQCRDQRGTLWLEDLARDLRYAWRQLLKQPGFFAVAAFTLAIAIGANTAVFGTFYGVLLRPFPYREPDRLAAVWCAEPSRGIPRMGCALPDLQEIASRNHAFEGLASYYFSDVTVMGGTPERVPGVSASASLFPLLGVYPELGRAFTSSEESFGKHQVVMLSHRLWQRRFGGSPGVIGESIRLDGGLYKIIGVMPAGFEFPTSDAELWKPLSFAPKDDMATRNNRFMNAIARLRPGAGQAQAAADVRAVARQLQHEFSDNAGVEAGSSEYLSSVVGDVRPALRILLGAVGIVLLIACVNVANLLLSRSSARKREFLVRKALGAPDGRLLRQLLSEGLLLGGLGAVLGVALSVWLVHLIRTLGPDNIPRLRSIEVDVHALVFTACLTLLSVLLFAAAPTLELARKRGPEALKDSGRSLTANSGTRRVLDALVVAQITLSLLLVVGAGLLFQTLHRLQLVEPGFKPENVLTASVSLPEAKYPEAEPRERARFFDELMQRVAQLPGVRAAGASTALPVAGWGGWGKYFTVDERPASRLADVPLIQYRQATPGYLRALGIPLLEGRFFTADDSGERPLVAVINESARRRFFPNENPIGKRVYPSPPEATIAKFLPSPDFKIPRLTVVGVIGDVRNSGVARPAEPELFVPYLQGAAKDNQPPSAKLFLTIRTDGDPLRYAAAVRAAVQSLDADQPVADVASMEERMEASLARQRFQLFLFGAFAGIALALAAVGVYGVMSYSVRQRMREIGIRMALGARGSAVLGMVIGRGLRLGAAGIAAGTLLSLGANRAMSSILFGVRSDDAATCIGAAMVLLVVVLGASLVPSLRAARTDPTSVLRVE